MDLGNLQIGIGLDLEGLDQQLDSLESRQITVGIDRIDPNDLKQVRESLSNLQLMVDDSQVREILNQLTKSFKNIEISLDTGRAERQLEDLNREITVTTDLDFQRFSTQLKQLETQTEQSLKKLEQAAVESTEKTYKVQVESASNRFVEALNHNSKAHTNVAPKAFAEVFKNEKIQIDKGGLLGRAAGSILTGGLEGAGRRAIEITIKPLEDKVFSGLTKAGELFADRTEKNFKSLFEDAGNLLGFQSSKIFATRISQLANQLDPFNYQKIKANFKDVFKIFSDTFIDLKVNDATLKDAFKGATKEATDELKKGSILAAVRFGGTLLKSLAPLIKLNREIKLQNTAKTIEPGTNLRAITPEGQEKRELTEKQIEKAVKKNAAVINIGGFQAQGGEGGFGQEEQIRSILSKEAEIITIGNESRDAGIFPEELEGALKKLIDLIPGVSSEQKQKSFESIKDTLPANVASLLDAALFRGASLEAERTVEVIKKLRAEGVEEIFVMGYSGGAFDALDAVNLAERAGIEGVKGVGIGGPILPGFSPESENYQNILGEADKFYQSLFNLPNRPFAQDMAFNEFSGRDLKEKVKDEDRDSLFYKFIQAASNPKDGTATGGFARAAGFQMPEGDLTPDGVGSAHWFENYIRSPQFLKKLNELMPSLFSEFVPSVRVNEAGKKGERKEARGVKSQKIINSPLSYLSEDINGQITTDFTRIAEQLMDAMESGNFQAVKDSSESLSNLLGENDAKTKEILDRVKGPLRDWIDQVRDVINAITKQEIPKIQESVELGGETFNQERYLSIDELEDDKAKELMTTFAGLVGDIQSAIDTFEFISRESEEVATFVKKVDSFVKKAAKDNKAFEEIAKNDLTQLKNLQFLKNLDLMEGMSDKAKQKFEKLGNALVFIESILPQTKLETPDGSDLGVVDVRKTKPDAAPKKEKIKKRETDQEKLFKTLSQGFANLDSQLEGLTKAINVLEAKLKEIDTTPILDSLHALLSDGRKVITSELEQLSQKLMELKGLLVSTGEQFRALKQEVDNLSLDEVQTQVNHLQRSTQELNEGMGQLLKQVKENQTYFASFQAELMNTSDSVGLLGATANNTKTEFIALDNQTQKLVESFKDVTGSIKAFQKAREAEFFENIYSLIGSIPLEKDAVDNSQNQGSANTLVNGVVENPVRFDKEPEVLEVDTEDLERAVENLDKTIDTEVSILDEKVKAASRDSFKLKSLPNSLTEGIDISKLSIPQMEELLKLLKTSLKVEKKLEDSNVTKLLAEDIKALKQLIKKVAPKREDQGSFGKTKEPRKEPIDIVDADFQVLESSVEEFTRELPNLRDALELQAMREQQIENSFDQFIDTQEVDPSQDLKQQFIDFEKAKDKSFADVITQELKGITDNDRFEESLYEAFEQDPIDEQIKSILDDLIIENVDTLIIEGIKNIEGFGIAEEPNSQDFQAREYEDPWAEVAKTAEEMDEISKRIEERNKKAKEAVKEPVKAPEVTGELAAKEKAEGLGGSVKLTDEQKKYAKQQLRKSKENAQKESDARAQESKTRLETIRENVQDIALIGGLLEKVVDKAQKDILELEKREEVQFKKNPGQERLKANLQKVAQKAREVGGNAADTVKRSSALALREAPENTQKMLSGTTDGIVDLQTSVTKVQNALSKLETQVFENIPGLGRLKDDVDSLGAVLGQPIEALGEGVDEVRKRLDNFLKVDFFNGSTEVPQQNKSEAIDRVSQLNRESAKLKKKLGRNPDDLELLIKVDQKALDVLKNVKNAASNIDILREDGDLSDRKANQSKAVLGSQRGDAYDKIQSDNRLLTKALANAFKKGASQDDLKATVKSILDARKQALEVLEQQGESGSKEFKGIANSLPKLEAVFKKLQEIPEETLKGLREADFGLPAKEGAKKYLRDFKDLLDINSPSKEFEYIGRMSARGVENGFQELNVKGQVDDLKRQGMLVGHYWTLGILQSIQDGNVKIANSGRDGAKALIKATRRALDINSPSGEGEDVGKNWGLGWLNKANEYYDKIIKSTKAFSNRLVEAASTDGSKNISRNVGTLAGGVAGEVPVRGVQAVKGGFNFLKDIGEGSGFLPAFANQFKESFGKIKKELPFLDRISGSFKSFGLEILQTVGIFSIGDLLADQAREGIQKILELDRNLVRLTTALGSRELAETALSKAADDADRLGISLSTARDQMSQLAAATKGTALAGAAPQLNDALNAAATSLQIDPERQKNAAVALAQIAGKGVLSQEEVRQQLGEAIPGITALLAEAYDVSVSDLNKRIETGSVRSVEALPLLAKALELEYSDTAELTAERSLIAQVNKIQNSVLKAQEGLGSFALKFAPLVTPLADSFGFLAENIEVVATLLASKLIASVAAIATQLGFMPKILTKSYDSFKAFAGELKALGNIRFEQLKKGLVGLTKLTRDDFSAGALKMGASLGKLKNSVIGLGKATLKAIGPTWLLIGAAKAAGLVFKALSGAVDPTTQTLLDANKIFKKTRDELGEVTKEVYSAKEAAMEFLGIMAQIATLDFEKAQGSLQDFLVKLSPNVEENTLFGANFGNTGLGFSTQEQRKSENFAVKFGSKENQENLFKLEKSISETLDPDIGKLDKLGRVDFELVAPDLRALKGYIRSLEVLEKKAKEGDQRSQELLDTIGGTQSLERWRKYESALMKASLSGGNAADSIAQVTIQLGKLQSRLEGLDLKKLKALQENKKEGGETLTVDVEFDKEKLANLRQQYKQLIFERQALQKRIDDPTLIKNLSSPDIEVADKAAQTQKQLADDVKDAKKRQQEIQKQLIEGNETLADNEKALAMRGAERSKNASLLLQTQKEITALQNAQEFTFTDNGRLENLQNILIAEKELELVKKRGTKEEVANAKKALADAQKVEAQRIFEARKLNTENDKQANQNKLANLRKLLAQMELEGKTSASKRAKAEAKIEVAEQEQLIKDLNAKKARLVKDYETSPNKNKEQFRSELLGIENEQINAQLSLIEARISLQEQEKENKQEQIDLTNTLKTKEEERLQGVYDLKKNGLDTAETLKASIERVKDSVMSLKQGAISGTIDLLRSAKDLGKNAFKIKGKDYKEAKRFITLLNGLRGQRDKKPLGFGNVNTQAKRERAIISLTKQRVKLELETLKRKEAGLLRQQDLAQKLLEIEIQKAKLQDKAALRSAQTELSKAKLTGDATQIQLAEIEVQAVMDQTALNRQTEWLQRAALASEQTADKQDLIAENAAAAQSARESLFGEELQGLNNKKFSALINPLAREINSVEKALKDSLLGKAPLDKGSAIQSEGISLGIFPDKPSTREDIAAQLAPLGVTAGKQATKGSEIASQLKLEKSTIDALTNIEAKLPQMNAELPQNQAMNDTLRKLTTILEQQGRGEITIQTTVEKKEDAGQVEKEVLGALETAFSNLATGI